MPQTFRTPLPFGRAWRPGAVRARVLATAARMVEHGLSIPDAGFYEAFANAAEEAVLVALSEAMDQFEDHHALPLFRHACRLHEQLADELWIVTEQCESPIECILAAHLLLEGTDGYNRIVYSDAWAAHPDPSWGTIWTAQHEFGGLRPDFLFKVCLGEEKRFLAVECDGHDWHDRTKEQARRDRSRDRKLLAGGIPVIRFTGSEIVRDPSACVEDLASVLSGLSDELLAKAGQIRTRRSRLQRDAEGTKLRIDPPQPS